MVLFKDIYKKAINLFDDPDIQKAYVFDTVRWEKLMYPHLISGLAMFNSPTKISSLLVDQVDPIGKIETFDGNGSNTYFLGSTPVENCDFCFMIQGKIDKGAVYNTQTNSVVFSKNVETGAECSAEWYFCGGFNTDFKSAATSNISSNVILSRVKEILARALVLEWAEKEKNFALDIRNILTDTDFKLYSPANSVKAKVEWVKQLKYDFDSMINKLSWDLLSRKYHGGNFYG